MGLLNETGSAYYNGSNLGGYQFTSLQNIIDQFMLAYVGEDKLISKIKRPDVVFHAQRALQEFSFDTFKSTKGYEITVPATLAMPLPQDYVNYVKLSWVDNSGVKHRIYPTSDTSNPSNVFQTTTPSEAPYYEFTNSELNPININSIDDRRAITITLPSNGGAGITDGDYIDLPFLNSQGSIETMSLVFSEDDDFFDGDSPGANDDKIRFGVRTHANGGAANSVAVIADKIVKVLNDTNRFEASKTLAQQAGQSTFVTVVYKEYLSSYSSEAARESDGTYQTRTPIALLPAGSVSTSSEANSDTLSNYQSGNPAENKVNDFNYDDELYDPNIGQRFGLDPQRAQLNGSFYIDEAKGFIRFSSNISGKTIILDYISDSLGTDAEMQVHKFAEEAMYKQIAYAVLSTRSNMPEYVVNRFRKEAFATKRKAKLRLSNIKLAEITQILRGKSKHIKH